MTPSTTLPRRHLLAASAAALSAAGLASWTGAAQAQATAAAAPKPLPGYAGWKAGNALIVHSSSTLETRRGAFGTSVVTPSSQLYVRNNLPAPDAAILDDRNAWVVRVEGVKNPREITLAELKTLGLETVATVLQCSGNGRGFFPTKPSGTPWTVGAAGCVVWSGVPVRNVVAALGGVASGMAYVTGTGGEKLPEGVDPLTVLVERSVPLKAMEDAILAWEMNGEPLSLAHGGPLRLIVPGYQGVNNIKYIKRLAFTEAQSQARIMQHGYRMTPPGAKASPDQPRPALGVGDDGQVLDQRPAARARAAQARHGAGAWRGLWRHAWHQGRGSVGRRWQDLAGRPAHRAGPGPVCLAPVCAAGAPGRRHPCAGQPRHRHGGQRAARAARGKRGRLQQRQLGRPCRHGVGGLSWSHNRPLCGGWRHWPVPWLWQVWRLPAWPPTQPSWRAASSFF